MDNGGAVADQLVNQSLKASEEIAKLTAWGVKHLATLLWALYQENKDLFKQKGIADVMADGTRPSFIPLEKEQLSRFKQEAKHFGVKYFTVSDKSSNLADVVVRGQDVRFVNRILEKMGYAERFDPEMFHLGGDEKNDLSLVQQENASRGQGNISKQNKMTTTSFDEKPSVAEKVENIKFSLQVKNDKAMHDKPLGNTKSTPTERS